MYTNRCIRVKVTTKEFNEPYNFYNEKRTVSLEDSRLDRTCSPRVYTSFSDILPFPYLSTVCLSISVIHKTVFY